MLGVDESEWDEFLTATLLALRGWAGMIWQLEVRGDRVAHPAPAGSLLEFLAVRLVLERVALTHLAQTTLDFREPLDRLRAVLRDQCEGPEQADAEQRAFVVFQLAQVRGWLTGRSASPVSAGMVPAGRGDRGLRRSGTAAGVSCGL